MPPTMDNKHVKFRNAVVHKGEIPTYEKVVEYAEYLYNLILDIIQDLKISYLENLSTVNFLDSFKRMQQESSSKDIININTVHLSTIIPLIRDGERRSFGESLESFKSSQGMYFSS